ncbi:tetratricopeptide repeat protein [Anoxynatronum buryatiense]|uniref:Tetratricopeptide repeat-containing protein n=1 Tax=Anoxynatronum buryatiense TaxID=489973 RepID=A0AA45WT17_9CLOT|nr:tetratricopeptide repeat protein [Anoxynatronum buryatiense]SMP39647.1 Tetratricopeptide repeat-containing protein [Anoxynatronum buryatiense]
MILYIFSATKKERMRLLRQYFYKELAVESELRSDGMPTSKVRGVKSITTPKHHRRIPGYWIAVEFCKNHQGAALLQRVRDQLPAHHLDGQVFFPKNELSGKELEKGWLQKYPFDGDRLEEVSRLFFQEIRSHLKEGRPGNALHGVLLILRMNPFFMRKYRRYYLLEDLAYAFDHAGNLGKVIRCFQLQAKIRPESPEPYLNISSFYIVNGMEDKAVQLLKKAVREYPDNPFLMSNLIIAMCNLGLYDAAVMILKKTLEKELKNGFYWKLLGDVFYEMEDNEAAIRCYKKAVREMDDEKSEELTADIHSGIAACYYEEEHYKKALEHYQKVLAIYPEDHYTLISLAQLYFYKMQNSKEALKYTKRILEVLPENGYAHYHIGLIYMDLNLIDKARWHLYKARRMMPYYNPVHEAIQMLKKNIDFTTGRRLNSSRQGE